MYFTSHFSVHASSSRSCRETLPLLKQIDARHWRKSHYPKKLKIIIVSSNLSAWCLSVVYFTAVNSKHKTWPMKERRIKEILNVEWEMALKEVGLHRVLFFVFKTRIVQNGVKGVTTAVVSTLSEATTETTKRR